MLLAPSPEQRDRQARAMRWNPRPWIGPLPEKMPLARGSAALLSLAVAVVALVDHYGMPHWPG